MDKVRRIYVEKKPAYAVEAKALLEDIRDYLGIKSVTNVRVMNRYDIENLSEDVLATAKTTVFSEPPVDYLYEEVLPEDVRGARFSVEYLPGQFDQRADSAQQCVNLLAEDEEPVIRSAKTYIIEGDVTAEDMEKIKAFCINPVDSRESKEEKPETLVTVFEEPADVKIFSGFQTMPEDELKALYESLNLAMTFKDFQFIQSYFAGEEKRDPSMTEIRVLDTYWSDHCRHTTFQTELKNVEFEEGYYQKPIKDTFDMYKTHFAELYANRDDKYVCLMDIALMAMKKLKKEGKLADQEESDEINACSIVVPVEIDGETEEWLVSFKNETHNHPTESTTA
jgi:phosphoribosylformylglycinamidine synthase